MSLCSWVSVQAQVSSCFDANLSPFCNGIAQYPANFDGTGSGSGPQAPAGPNYGCLGTQGNPTYFSLTVEQTGSINFTLDNSANVDIDFILWGPFSSIAAATNACDSMGQGGIWGDVDTCSYSFIAQEPVSISNAVAGEVYILMVTNYSNTATNIFSTFNSGSGYIACPCEIPNVVDTLPALAGNQGYLTDTVNQINQFVVCPNQLLGIEVGARSNNPNDTLGLYAPFTTLSNDLFVNNTIFTTNPNLPSYDSLTIFATITPQSNEIGVNNFSFGVKNNIYTGGLSDSSCFDQINIQVVVPGVQLNNRNICSGQQIQIEADSIPTTSIGSSNYSWSQLSGPTVQFSSVNQRIIVVTIPTSNNTSTADSIQLQVDYSYGSLCPMKDTLTLYFKDVALSLTASKDSLCSGDTTLLSVSLSDTLSPSICDDYTVSSISYAPISGSATTLSLADDELSSILPIGFNFNFYCNNYNSFYISSNGFISFDPNAGNGLVGQLIPDPNLPNDLIALCWTDNNPSIGGTISYFTTGTAPNRQLVVNFINVPPFGIGTGNQTVQAILFETTNIIELHVGNATPNGLFSTLTLGLENADGTIAHSASGTNATSNTLSNQSYRFQPVDNGPFYSWTPNSGLNNDDLANVTAVINNSTSYQIELTDGVCVYEDSINISVQDIQLSLNPDIIQLSCDLLPIGSLSTQISTNQSTVSYTWSNGSTQASINGLAVGNYSVTVSNSLGCSDSSSQQITAPIVPTLNAYVSVTGLTSITVPSNSYIFLAAGTNNYTYAWTSIDDPIDGSANINLPNSDTTTAYPSPEGNYTFLITASVITNDTLCQISDTLYVLVETPFKGIPDAFSPNNDQTNDVFGPVGLKDSELLTFKIFNRWGQEVFDKENQSLNHWDGLLNGVAQPADVYIYLISYQRTGEEEVKTLRGEVTLMR
jgi:gliding motility-associated-like protein